MTWTVEFSRRAARQAGKLPRIVSRALELLVSEMEALGPVRGNWRNYSRLTEGRHHCHLRHGRPTYVAVWEEKDGNVKIIEVTYVGTHEKAPY